MARKNALINKNMKDISSIFGIKRNDRTIFEVQRDEECKNLKLISSKFGKEPWFAIDDESLKVIVQSDLLLAILHSLRNAERENFELKLERSILQRYPIDFNDVWAVAIDEIRNYKHSPSSLNLDKILDNIKKKHPNLFINLDAHFKHRRTDNDKL